MEEKLDMLDVHGSLHFQITLEVASIEAHGSFGYFTEDQVDPIKLSFSILTLIGRSSWMLLECGGGLNQHAPFM